MTKLPEGSGIDWLIAAGVPKEEMEKVLAKEKRTKDTQDTWERSMGYNPLPWNEDRNLQALLRFLVEKSEEEIRTFAAWSKGQYSNLKPAKARQYPRFVIDCWNLAFEKHEEDNSIRARLARERMNDGN